MASETRLGVSRTMSGVRLRLGSLTLDLSVSEAGQLHEEIGRALMPGQARHPLYGCCEHCGQCQQPGSCEHGGDQPPHLRPCAFDDCEQGHKAVGEAVITEACRRADGEAPAAEAREQVTRAEVDRCGYSEDPFHRCRACYDYAAGRERDHPPTAGAPAAGARDA